MLGVAVHKNCSGDNK